MHHKIPALLLFVFTIAQSQGNSTDSTSTHNGPVYYTGHEIPHLTFVPLNGKPFELKDLKGKVVVINVWFTTCSPCQDERPLLNRLVEKYKSDEIIFIAIARNTEPALRKYLEHNQFSYEQTIFTDETKSVLDYYFPRNLVVDKNGIVIEDSIGFGFAFTEKNLDKAISEALTK